MDGTPKDFSDARAFDTGNTVFLSDVMTRIKTELEGNQRRDALSAFNALEKQAGVDLLNDCLAQQCRHAQRTNGGGDADGCVLSEQLIRET